MNSLLAQNTGLRNYHSRVAIAISLILLVSLKLLPTSAQSNSQRRITSVWTAMAGSGSIVHVFSDAPVNDYEAYSQRGRFYVRIGAAGLPSAHGSLLGRGFDDVQINKSSNGVILSFHLSPGSTARVDQTSNRLDIVFTIPSKANAPENASIPLGAYGSARHRPRPGPAASPSAGEDSVTSSSATVPSSALPESANPTPADEVAAASPSSSASAFASSSPGIDTSANLTSSSPASVPVATTSPAAESPLTTGAHDTNWRSRLNYWKVWAQLNWAPLLIGFLVFLAIVVLLLYWRAFRRINAAPINEWKAANETVQLQTTASNAENTPATALGAAAGVSHSSNQRQVSNSSQGQREQNEGPDPDREVFEI